MNKEKLLALAAHLEALPPEAPGFDMAVWYDYIGGSTHDCGTIACLAGHAVLLENNPQRVAELVHGATTTYCSPTLGWQTWREWFQAEYDLDFTTATRLTSSQAQHRTIADAILVIRTLVETGHVYTPAYIFESQIETDSEQ